MDRKCLRSRRTSYSSSYGEGSENKRSFCVSENIHGQRLRKMTETLYNGHSIDVNDKQSVEKKHTANKEPINQVSSVSLDVHPLKSYSDLRKQLCQSDNEYKAQKLNKAEESKLQNLKARVQKEQALYEKEFIKTAHLFRAQSAKYLRDPYDKLSSQSSVEAEQTNRSRNVRPRPKSSPIYSYRFQSDTPNVIKKEQECRTCKKMQNIILEYERLTSTNDMEHGGNVYTRYLFSDRQMKTFINILEAKYCTYVPEMSEVLHRKFHSLEDINRVGIQKTDRNTGYHGSNVQHRIPTFCKAQVVFNKQHPLPENIKLGLEHTRMAQAVATKRRSSAHISMMSEVRARLGLPT